MLKFDQPTLVTITGPTCSGKNYLRDAIEQTYQWGRIISTTTRKQRTGEVHGRDYYFISEERSHELERQNELAELVTFRGVRYGVTHEEMTGKMTGELPSMVILEPTGIELYKHMCVENNWDIFTIYVSVQESLQIDRLNRRTFHDALKAHEDYDAPRIKSIIGTHTDRLLSITGDERRWSRAVSWDAILPGDNVEKALEGLRVAVNWRNRKTAPPTAYEHKAYV